MPDAARDDDDLTQLLKRMSAGETDATEAVAGRVYQELRRQAAFALSREHRYHSLEPTLLVNEAFVRLIRSKPIDWQDRHHFFSLTTRMMRRIIVDYFKEQSAQKR